jgi:hypothetical protein
MENPVTENITENNPCTRNQIRFAALVSTIGFAIVNNVLGSGDNIINGVLATAGVTWIASEIHNMFRRNTPTEIQN